MARPGDYAKKVKPYLDDIKKWVESGATNEEIAKALGINKSTLCKYKNQYKELNDSFARGRAMVVCDIKAALLKKAMGFHYEEKKQTLSEKNGMTTEIYNKYCPPSETAAAMLLRNYDESYHDGDAISIKFKEQEQELKRKIAENRDFIE